MQGIRPCPYCGGEIEVVKLVKRKEEKKSPYRIQCLKCRALVARGIGFPNESAAEAKERIQQYDEVIAKKMGPLGNRDTILTAAAKRRDIRKAKAILIDKNDAEFDIHDATGSFGHKVRGDIGKFEH